MNLVQKNLRGKTIVPSVNSAVLLALYGDLEDLFGGDLEGLFGVTFLGDFLRNEGLVLATIFGLLLRSSTAERKATLN